MQAIVQIIKVNEARKGKSAATGRDWEMQDCECILLDDQGQVAEVGVLMLPKDLTGKTVAGTYTGTFALRANKGKEGGRRIEAVLVGLAPYATRQQPQQPAKVQ